MPKFPKILPLCLCSGQRLGLYIQGFYLHVVGCDGFDYFGDISKAIVVRSSDCERQGESDDKDKGGKGEGVHF